MGELKKKLYCIALVCAFAEVQFAKPHVNWNAVSLTTTRGRQCDELPRARSLCWRFISSFLSRGVDQNPNASSASALSQLLGDKHSSGLKSWGFTPMSSTWGLVRDSASLEGENTQTERVRDRIKPKNTRQQTPVAVQIRSCIGKTYAKQKQHFKYAWHISPWPGVARYLKSKIK